jgi:hypothetical protein
LTLTGGLIAIWILLFLKYDPTYRDFGGVTLFGDSLETPTAVWKYMPIAMVVGGYLMASRLPMPKVGMTKNKLVSAALMTLVISGYICGFAMSFPEICFGMPTIWSIMFLIWGQASAKARAMYPPPLFPKKNDDRKLERPQEDLEDIVLDEDPPSGQSPAAPVEPPV